MSKSNSANALISAHADPADAAGSTTSATGGASRVQRRRDRRRAEIVHTATRVLSESGYQGMSLEDVAERTDIAKATLYHYFPSKDALVDAALEALTVEVLSRLEARRKSVENGSAEDILRALVDEQILILTEIAPENASVFSWPRAWPESLAEKLKDIRVRHNAPFRDVVVKGVSSGEFSCPNLKVSMQCLHGILNQSPVWIRPDVASRDRALVRKDVVDCALRIFLAPAD